ncbi:hypothetical protein ACTXJU_17545, partial [Glutamicibacter ardleyensis]
GVACEKVKYPTLRFLEPRHFTLMKRSTNQCSAPGGNNSEAEVLPKPPSKAEPAPLTSGERIFH